MQLKPFIHFFLSGLMVTSFVGCQLLRPYRSPLTPTPIQWKTENKEEASANSTDRTSQESSGNSCNELQDPRIEDIRHDLYNWWEIFQDPVLNQLEEQALNSSYTLWAALERVIEARAQARIQFAPLLPAINFAPSFSRTGLLYQNPFEISGIGSSSTTGSLSSFSDIANAANTANAGNNLSSLLASIPNDFRFIQTQYLVPLNLNYELDVWGQLRDAYYAAIFRAQAASQAYLSVLLSLTADVASTYFQTRSLDTQQEVIQGNIKVRQQALEISQARYRAGIIVYTDVSRAEVELARARSDADDTARLRGLQENLLGTLVGIPAPIFSIAPHTLSTPPPKIPTGLPSELLCRRPDIVQAERNLAAAYEDIGVAYANFFPSLQLNAAIGFESPFAYQLFNWRSRLWQVGWSVLQTVFDAGRTQANYDYYRARFCEAMANYQQTVLSSFQDVEDALVSLRQYAIQARDLTDAVRAARLTLELSQLRYIRGLVNYLDVVDAERQLLQTEQTLAIVVGNRYISTVQLIRALGGGWGPCETSWEESPSCTDSSTGTNEENNCCSDNDNYRTN